MSQGSETKLGGGGSAGKVTGGRGREKNGVERTIETRVKKALRRAKMGREEEKKGRKRKKEGKWSGRFRQDVCVLRSVESEAQKGREKARTDQKPRQAGGDIRKSISGAGGGGEASCVLPPPHTHTSYQRSHGPPPYCRCAGAAESAGPRGGLAGRPGGWRRQARQQAGQAGGCGQGFSRSGRSGSRRRRGNRSCLRPPRSLL